MAALQHRCFHTTAACRSSTSLWRLCTRKWLWHGNGDKALLSKSAFHNWLALEKLGFIHWLFHQRENEQCPAHRLISKNQPNKLLAAFPHLYLLTSTSSVANICMSCSCLLILSKLPKYLILAPNLAQPCVLLARRGNIPTLNTRIPSGGQAISEPLGTCLT